MASEQIYEVEGYALRADRLYQRETHLWLERQSADTARFGLDPLGRETSGDVVAVSFREVGSRIIRGEAFGDLEAAKFVGPLRAPATGTVVAHNEAILADPGLLNDDAAGHWLVEVELHDPHELDDLLGGEAAVAEWFAAEVRHFRSRGAIAR